MFRKPEANPSFPALEAETLTFWREARIFEQSVRGEREFVFYDGPPFATGTPHYGHLLAGTLKDIVPRYQAMRGFRVERRFGWDTHGLPVEMEIDKQLGLQSPSDVEAYGVGRYNEACRAVVLRYTAEWKATVERMGRWVDFENDYKTMDPPFMESVWWVFKTLWDKGLVYRGHKVMPYSWRLGTPLSNFEAGMDYRTVQDPAVTVRFPLKERPGVSILAWTTTPWTLPANMALCVGPAVEYVTARKAGSSQDEPAYIVAALLAETVLGPGFEVLATCLGSDLVGLHYEPPFAAFADAAGDGAFRVVSDPYVTTEDGTGVVHTAPAFGEDDHRIALAFGLPLRDPVDAEGRFTGDVTAIAGGAIVGMHVKDADKLLIRDLKDRGLLFAQATLDHEYPFCWRSGTPLIYKAISTWFVKVSALRERMVELNQQTRWVPEFVGTKRFDNWLRDARDWAISRNRFWGTPLPVWQCSGCGHFDAIGSIAELHGKSGVLVHDLHKHHVDGIEWPCPTCPKDSQQVAPPMRRVPEVLDCWFESGSMPYAQNHYPFENKEMVERNLPAAFIAEGLDQTRGWFYTLLVLSTALFDRPAFKNVVVNGLILAEDGQKMSKRLKNYPDPMLVIDTYGADALRAYLVTSPAVRAEPMRFAEAGVREVVRSVVLPLWNAYGFFATYAAAEGWQPPQEPSPLAERGLLDRWIVSVLQSVVRDVNTEMEGYRLYTVIPRVLGFIDDLTNWYIRRSRRRFWKNDDARDHQHAFETLYEVLCGFSRLVAPILPFTAELLYQRLEVGQRDGALASVHLESFPRADAGKVDAGLEEAMAVARTLVGLGRNLREQHKIRVRQPLASLTVAYGGGTGFAQRFADPSLQAILRDELNVRALKLSEAEADLVDISAKANFKTLGKRLGARMKVVAAGMATLTAGQIRAIEAGELVEIEGEAIRPDDLLVQKTPRAGLVVATEGQVTVGLDTTVTPELRLEGLAREVVSKVQAARKEAGLQVEDRISLSLRPGSPELAEAIRAHARYICDEVLAVELTDSVEVDHTIVDAGGEGLGLALRKV